MRDAVAVEHLVEILFAQPLGDQPAEPVFGGAQPAGKIRHLQLGLAVDLQHFQLVSQCVRQPRFPAFIARGRAAHQE
jgi:hypothetical protein